MKKIVLFLIVIAGICFAYCVIGNALVESGSKSINSVAVKMQQAGV